MNREILLQHLTEAEQRIGAGESQATRLRQDLARQTKAGEATAETERELQTCAQAQAALWAERAQLFAALSKAGKCDADSHSPERPMLVR